MIVDTGIYKHYKYIITYTDTPFMFWYCAYIVIPSKLHPLYGCKNYHITNIDVHGGLTFADFWNLTGDECFCIGWDYHHSNDYCGKWSEPDSKHWSIAEIQQECKSTIEQVIKFEHKLIKIYDE